MTTYDDLELLKSIKAPSDLKKLNTQQLSALAEEMRSYMISTVSKNGGHLASNLGIVELTIALHLCFDFKKDRLVFDVGHQCYPHKLLTGRAEAFSTLRTKDGISGFPKTCESEYDAFNVGHSSTAISAGLGMLRAMRLRGDTKSRVVAVVGDGAMTGGLAYEALDDAGESELPFIVILNDNRMSISGNVGGLSAHLSGLRTSKGYKRFKRRLSGNLKKVPRVGKGLSKRIERFKNRIKYFILPNVLFEELGLPAKKKTKSGYSTNADVLEELRNYSPIVDNVLKYRQYTKLNSTYVDALLDKVAEDGRIHTCFRQTETRTGRISSTEPNVQNIPVRTELGSQMRKFFTASSGRTLVDADYSQIELRVMAHLCGDENMIAAFNSGEDIHTSTAAQVFDMPPVMVTPEMRSAAKAVNFGIIYGIGAFSLSKDIGTSVAQAKKYIADYLAKYPKVNAFMENTVDDAMKTGVVATMFGRKRRIPELLSSNKMLQAAGKRIAMNTPVQGTAADLIKIAMINVYRRLKAEGLAAELILQVHDELIIESDLSCADRAVEILKEEMQGVYEMKVPLAVDVHTGNSWYDAKG